PRGRRDVAQIHDPRERRRRQPKAEHREAGEQDAELGLPSTERRAVRGNDALVRHQERRGGDDDDEQEAGGVARRVAHVALQRHDRRERTDALLHIGDGARRRRRCVAGVEEDARSRGRLRERGLARHRAHEEDRARAERDRERGDDDDEIAAREAASEGPPPRDDGALTNSACAARAQARPSSASAMTVSPSTKKNASLASPDAALATLLMARAYSSAWTTSCRTRNARLGKANSAATIHSQVTRRSSTFAITASRNPIGGASGGTDESRRWRACSSGSRSSSRVRSFTRLAP